MNLRRSLAAAFVGAAAAALLSAAPGDAPPSDVPGLLVSRQLMEAEGLREGDVVSLSTRPSGDGARRFRVIGQYEPTPDPMRLGAVRHEVRMHLPDLIDLASDPSHPVDAETVDAVNVRLADGTPGGDIARRLTNSVPGTLVDTLTSDNRRAAPFVVLERFHLAIAIVTVLASSVFLLALMLMLIEERKATVGILRLIGFRKVRILQHVLAEGVVIAIAGALFGVVLSMVMEGGINRFFQWRYDTTLVFVRISPGVALRSIAVSVPLGVAAILASSWSLLRHDAFPLTRR